MNFRELFYDEIYYKEKTYLLSNEELKIKPDALNLTLMTFCKLSAVKYSLESDSN